MCFRGQLCCSNISTPFFTFTQDRESIAYPYMDFQKSTDINIDIHDFWMSVLSYPFKFWYPHLISKEGCQCKDILQWIFVNNKYSWMDIHVLRILFFNCPCFYGYPCGYPWISIDIHAFTCYGFSIQGTKVYRSILRTFATLGLPLLLLIMA